MDRKTGVVAGLFGVAAIFAHGTPFGSAENPDQRPAGAATSSESRPPIPSKGTTSKFGPWTPVCAYLSDNASSDSRNSVSLDVKINGSGDKRTVQGNLSLSGTESYEEPKDRDGILKQFCFDPSGQAYTRKVAIATVPDPELTHLSLFFDRKIESVTWAAADGDLGDERYLFNGYWFPWRPPAGQEADSAKRESDEKARESRVNSPGILFFRGFKNSHKLLLVFLVGETPTSGINRVAFRSAWAYANALKNRDLPVCQRKPNEGSCMGILGPSFTGSLSSLRLLLDWQNLSNPAEVAVISGSVTGILGNPLAPSHFCTTLETDYHKRAALFGYTANILPREFAFLEEDETAYGFVVSANGAARETGALILPYPRGIARIRNLSGQLPNLSTLNNTQNAGYPVLPLDLRDAGQDSIPSFGMQTPVSQEAVLIALAATLRRERIRYVGIVATDPLDALFLSRSVRELAPGVRIVLFHTDLLFARAAQAWGLKGILAVSSYPLVARNQSQASPNKRTQFSSESAEGEYNAFRRMLLLSTGQAPTAAVSPDVSKADPWCESALDGNIPPAADKADYLLDYASPFAGDDPKHLKPEHRPYVWINVLGNDAWWPIEALPPALPSTLASPLLFGPAPGSHSSEHFRAEVAPRLWIVFFWFIWIACAAHVFLTYLMNDRYRPSWWKHASLRVFGWGFKPELESQRRGMLAFASLAVAAVCLFLGLAVKVSAREGPPIPPFTPESLFEVVFAFALGAAAIVEGIWAAGKSRLFTMAALACAVLTIAAVLMISMSSSEGHATQFAGYRAMHLESGTSPVVPIVALLWAFYLSLYFRLSQLRVTEDRPAVCPTVALGLRLDPTETQGAVLGLDLWQRAATAFAVICWLGFFNAFHALATLERPTYTVVVVLISTSVVALLTVTLVRFLRMWGTLRRLLQDLERHPLRYAFSRLPKDFSWTAVWTGDPRPKLYLPMRSLEVLRMIPEGRDQVEAVKHALKFLNPPHRSFQPQPPNPAVSEATANLNSALNTAAEATAKHLGPTWDMGISDTIASREKGDEAPAEWTEHPNRIAREEFLALRFVAFIHCSLSEMRSSLALLGYVFILLVAALTLYPFEGRGEIGVALVLTFVIIGGFCLMVFAQMDRSPLLSRLSATAPNELSLNFVYRVVSFGALPLLSLLASQVPEVGNLLVSWLQPAMQAVK
jgi:hypothetical protein